MIKINFCSIFRKCLKVFNFTKLVGIILMISFLDINIVLGNALILNSLISINERSKRSAHKDKIIAVFLQICQRLLTAFRMIWSLQNLRMVLVYYQQNQYTVIYPTETSFCLQTLMSSTSFHPWDSWFKYILLCFSSIHFYLS